MQHRFFFFYLIRSTLSFCAAVFLLSVFLMPVCLANEPTEAEKKINVPDSATIDTLVKEPRSLEWKIDLEGTLTVNDLVASQSSGAETFFERAEAKFPHKTGTIWFRLRLPAYDSRTLYLDLNTLFMGHISDTVQAWMVKPVPDGFTTEALPMPSARLFQLPTSAATPITIYLRANSIPSPGFIPTIREVADLAQFEFDGLFWPCVILTLCFLLALVRGVIEHREWRLWCTLYMAAVLTAMLGHASVAQNGTFLSQSLPHLLAPGIALLLLPNVGRLFMHTSENAPGLDLMLIIAGLTGLIIGLIPLLPQCGWTTRFLPLWPLGICLLWLPMLTAIIKRMPGSLWLLLSVLLPPLGFLPLAVGHFPGSPGMIKLFPSMMLCAGTLFLVLAPTPAYPFHRDARRQWNARRGQHAPLELFPDDESLTDDKDIPELQKRLNLLDNELTALSELPVQKEFVKKFRTLLSAIEGIETAQNKKNEVEASVFSLQQIILEAHNALQRKAEKKNLSLSWHMSPQLSRQYLADRSGLSGVLRLLLESSIDATEHGTIQIRAQRLPDSNDPGQIVFTVSDTGSGTPPDKRDTSAVCLAWQMAARLGGSLHLTTSPAGTTVTFTLRLQPAGEKHSREEGTDELPVPSLQPSGLRVFIVSDVPDNRQLLAYYLDELPHELREARSTDEAVGMYMQSPGALMLFDGDLAEDDLVETLAKIRSFEGEQGLPSASLLTLTNSEEQAEHLMRAGCTAVLPKPVSRVELRRLVLRLAPLPRPRKTSAELSPKTSSASLPSLEKTLSSQKEISTINDPAIREKPDQVAAASDPNAARAPEGRAEATADTALPDNLQNPISRPESTLKERDKSKGIFSSIMGIFRPQNPQTSSESPSPVKPLPSTVSDPAPIQKKVSQNTLENTEKLPERHMQNTDWHTADSTVLANPTNQAATPEDTAKPVPSPLAPEKGETSLSFSNDDEPDIDVSPLLQRLKEQKEAMQAAFYTDDAQALRVAASEMAQTADELKLPSLSDLAKCIALEEGPPDTGLIEAAIETAQQALE